LAQSHLECAKIDQKGIHIEQPVLCLSSDKSIHGQEWSEDYFHGDAVLNVNDIKHYSQGLGESVEYIQIKGGMHDLYLSRSEVRKEALERSASFFEKYL
jgi:alpha-beta hydrolase superfamily lysophospholipase